jgi:2-dehydro-3-deoxyphosphooctonate aldolase (KDO 8-P synthase)
LWKSLSARRRLVVVAGPCVIESEALCHEVARFLRTVCRRLGVPLVFKASYDKANRTSGGSFRGPGWAAGLEILERVRRRQGVPVMSDVHTEPEARAAGSVLDVVQIPAFLCRQTDLVAAAAQTGRILNLKKGQFLSPAEMGHVVRKAQEAGAKEILVTERGTTFGYHNLVADMRSIPILQRCGFPVLFDATHAVQLPGGGGDRSGGQREFAPVLACAAVAAGADGVFVETHPEPDQARSDGPNMVPLAAMPKLLSKLVRVYEAVRGR